MINDDAKYTDLDVDKSLVDQVICKKTPEATQLSSYSWIDRELLKKNEAVEAVNQEQHSAPLKLVNNVSVRSADKSVNSYFERIGATLVPCDLFEHVTHSVKKYLKLNLKVEYLYDTRDQLYWFASIKYTHGNLVYLKFLVPKLNFNEKSVESDSSEQQVEANDDEEDEDEEILLNDSEKRKFYLFYLLNPQDEQRLRPIGWSKKHGFPLKIPGFIFDKLMQKHQTTSGILAERLSSKTASFLNRNVHSVMVGHFFESLNKADSSNLTTKCISQVKRNQLLELQDFRMPLQVWFVRVVENVGGRLLLEYYFDDSQENGERFWLFYLDTHLHYIGWAKNNNLEYKLPVGCNRDVEQVESFVENVLNMHSSSPLLIDLFKNQHKLYPHRFQLGHMLEILYENKFYVASIVELLNANYFKVKLHINKTELAKMKLKSAVDEDDGVYLNFTSNSQNIFPVKWCEQNGLCIQMPNNWSQSRAFNWEAYIDICNRGSVNNKTAFYTGADQSLFSSIISRHLTNISEKYKVGAFLECVNPRNADEICVGQIKLRVKHLLFIRIKSNEDDPLYIFTQNSLELFPSGWCEMNNFKSFVIPNEFLIEKPATFQIRNDIRKIPYLVRFNHSDLWCDCLYLNVNYSHGSELSFEKIYKLPKSIGPGPIVLVISTLIQLLINSSKNQLKFLKLLQLTRDLRKNMVEMTFKAKNDKEKVLKRPVEICTNRVQLNEYLSQLSIKLNCCFEFFSFTKQSAALKCSNEECIRCSKLFSNVSLNSLGTDKPASTIAKLTKMNTMLNKLPKRVSNTTPMTGNGNKRVKVKPSIKSDPMRTRLKLRKEGLDPSTSGYRPRPKMRRLDNENSIDLNENQIEIHDEEDEDEVENNEATSSRNGYYKSDPLTWTVEDVCAYLRNNDLNDERIIQLINQNEFDGQAFLMLNLPFIQKFTNLKLGPSVKLLNLVEKLKVYYFKTFVKSNRMRLNENGGEDDGDEDNENSEDDDEEDDDEGDEDEDDLEIENQDENFNRLD